MAMANLIIVGPPPLCPISRRVDEITTAQGGRAKPPALQPIPLKGDVGGDGQRSVYVTIDGDEVEVYIDGEKGPIMVQLNGSHRHGESGLGRYQDGQIGHEGSKAWADMGRTERECHIVRIAKRQKAVQERRRESPDSQWQMATGAFTGFW
mmetsp:Transcript_29679/g.91364  ORF Transcript_29679/g.91364 Transcript_29679/m.91364 type:complete len:151 (+) Transcript_29679:55-507(+)